METRRENTGFVFMKLLFVSILIEILSAASGSAVSGAQHSKKKPYACLNAETGKPYDFKKLRPANADAGRFYFSAVIMIAQARREVNQNLEG